MKKGFKMKIKEAQNMARIIMDWNGLNGWTLEIGRGSRILGTCYHYRKLIRISKFYIENNDVKLVMNTLLHEIAHAYLGSGYGHGKEWKTYARSIGCTAQRVQHNVTIPEGKIKYACPCCGEVTTRYRKTSKKWACKPCCIKHNNSVFSYDFVLLLVK